MEQRVKSDKEIEVEKLIQLLDSIEYLTQPVIEDDEMGDIVTIMQSTYSGPEREAIKHKLLTLLKIEVL